MRSCRAATHRDKALIPQSAYAREKCWVPVATRSTLAALTQEAVAQRPALAAALEKTVP